MKPAAAAPDGEPYAVTVRRSQAERAVAEGHFESARASYDQLLAIAPNDVLGLREAGRVAHALGDFVAAADLLSRATVAIKTPDPELHYLLGEALWTLGRTAEARAMHERALAELHVPTAARMSKLWAARIHARLGDPAAADQIYEGLIATNPADAEVSLAQVEMHAAAKNWVRAERAIRRFITMAPAHQRAQELLAWIQEAQGNLDGELQLREKLAIEHEHANSIHDYGRVLERSGDWAGALVAYRKALHLPGASSRLELTSALARMDLRMSPEIAAGVMAKSDPGASTIGGFAGVAVPFGRAHHITLSSWHELASKDQRDGYGGEVAASVSLNGRVTHAIAGLKFGLFQFDDPSVANEAGENKSQMRPGAFGSAGAKLFDGHVQVTMDAELGSVWRETPRAVLEGGNVDAVTTHFFGVLLSNRLVTDMGVQMRQLRLEETMAGAPTSTQALAWAGADYSLWTDFSRQAAGETFDDDLLRPTYLADSVVLSYRHYELWGNTNAMFNERMSLADRASIDEVSVVARKALADGLISVEARAGGGRDWVRQLYLSRGGASLWIAPSARSRLSLSFDLAKESTRALSGERRSGWMTYHVDL